MAFTTGDSADQLVHPFLTPATLAMALWPSGPSKWIAGKHLLFASHKIAHAVRRGNGRLCISMPPRHGKSRLVGEAAVPWFLEEFPGRHVILISYNGDKAQEWGRKARDMIRNRTDLFSIRVREDMARTDRFETDTGAEAHFVGINGGVTGKGGHLVIIDDFIKDINEALSPAHRERQWMQFLANLDTRLEPGATVIIVATRWHSDDLIGRVTQRMEDWEVISLPALAQKHDPLGREEGEPLFPERYDRARLDQIRRARTGTYLWESMYQQQPFDEALGLTDPEWFEIIDHLDIEVEARLRRARAWDLAATEEGGDWTVGALLAKDEVSSACIIENIKRKQLSPHGVEKLVRNTAEADGDEVEVIIEQEPGAAGKALAEHYQRNVLPDFRVRIVTATTKKMARAQPFIAAAEHGRIRLKRAAWNEVFLNEFETFPSGKFDDQVDCCAMGYTELFRRELKSPTWRPGAGNMTFASYHESLSDPEAEREHSDSTLIKGLVW